MDRRKELGRGERVLPGLWRLRLPLPLPGVPHCNAWAIRAADGFVLVDTGMHLDDSLANLERALDMVDLQLEDCHLLIATHAHMDHWGQAATVRRIAGCEFLMHPDHRHATRNAEDPDRALARRLEVGRQSGVSAEALARYAERSQAFPSGVAEYLEPDRPLTDGGTVTTSLGDWEIIFTPGHAPSHICLYQPERRLLISGDHLLGRISLYYDYGWTPDPVAEYLASLDRIAGLDVRLCLSGHGRPFTDIGAHIDGTRALVNERLDAAAAAIALRPMPAMDVAQAVRAAEINRLNAGWFLTETLCYLRHLKLTGRAVATTVDGVECWTPAKP